MVKTNQNEFETSEHRPQELSIQKEISQPPLEEKLVVSSTTLDHAKSKEEEKDDNNIALVCAWIKQSLDMRLWALVRYHKKGDLANINRHHIEFNPSWISSLAEDDTNTRDTIFKFNRIF